MLKKLILIALAALLLYAGMDRNRPEQLGTAVTDEGVGGPSRADSPNTDHAVEKAFTAETSGLQVQGEGEVIRILSDDNDGSQHQRFIIRTASAQTLLVAHNVDLAPRIVDLKVGDKILFNGEYEWNSQGGVIHWTHRDPERRHTDGWIKHSGRQYQ